MYCKKQGMLIIKQLMINDITADSWYSITHTCNVRHRLTEKEIKNITGMNYVD